MKYILVFEKWLFSFDRSNMQIFTVNITRVVWPHVTIPLDLRHFCQHNTLFYYLNLVPCLYWSWQRNIYFWWIFLSDILFPCRKVASNKESHNSGNINGENLHIWAVERKKNYFSKTELNFYKKNYTTIIRTYWATKYESRSESKLWVTCHSLFDACWH